VSKQSQRDTVRAGYASLEQEMKDSCDAELNRLAFMMLLMHGTLVVLYKVSPLCHRRG